ncbi:MAG TPA: O-antigen ligase domain-containing protein, partial [Coleofasciculaceae cyanobacterium]
MSPQALLALLSWIPIVIYIFRRFPPQRALIISFIAAWLFLPAASFSLPGIPDLTKMSATCYGILLATIIYDIGRFKSLKLGWLDWPMLIWCLCPFASSIANGLGAYDGLSSALDQTVTWGFPYFLGRLYLSNLDGLRQLAIGIFIGGLLYVPLCLLENIISPQLHRIIYGFYGHGSGISQAYRYGGWRPMVFMSHGLMVGVWMMSATLIGIWLWRTGIIKQVWGIPISWLVGVLLITFILARSTGAYTLLLLGLVILFVARWLHVALPLLLLIAGMTGYLYISADGTFSSDQIVSITAELTNEERAQSLEFRLQNEEMLGEKARQ